MPSASPSPRKLGSAGRSHIRRDMGLVTAAPPSPSLPSPGSAHCWETRLLTAGPKPCRATLPAPRSASFQARCGRHPPPPSSHGLFSSMAATPPRMFFLRPRGLCAAVTSCGPAAVLLPGAPSRAAPLQPRSSPGSCGLCLGFPLPHPPSSCSSFAAVLSQDALPAAPARSPVSCPFRLFLECKCPKCRQPRRSRSCSAHIPCTRSGRTGHCPRVGAGLQVGLAVPMQREACCVSALDIHGGPSPCPHTRTASLLPVSSPSHIVRGLTA